MNFPRPIALKILLWGLLAFALLTIRFSPNWVVFYHGVREAKLNASSPEQSVAIDNAVLSGYSARGAYVALQAADLQAEIDDPNHKIVRWRLLVPALGYVLKLPGWITLGLAHFGCLVLIITLTRLGAAQPLVREGPLHEAMCFSVITGASAPFFTSMGLLGYYDAWLALGLLGVAFAQPRSLVLIACVLTPWIDERFVLGLPLALCVRWIRSESAAESTGRWFKQEALIPLIVVAAYAIVRLQLGGSRSSQTVADYLNEFVFTRELSLANYLVGAWEGLRLGWVLVAAALVGTWAAAPGRVARLQAVLLTAGMALTALIGLFTALDLSRSMVLLFPVLPLGWIYAKRQPWSKGFYASPLLAAAALVLPAHHVVGESIRPVDNIWSPPTPLTHFLNTLGVRYLDGVGVKADSTEAAKWFRKAAEQGVAAAQYNLGLLYARGDGVARDLTAAARWHRKAADQGLAAAEHIMGVMYAVGDGVAKDSGEAFRWYRKAAEQGYALAQSNLGVKYLEGIGVAKDSTEAAKWFRKAAEQGYAPAQSNLGVLYFRGVGVEKDMIRARAWWQIAAAAGLEDAINNMAMSENQMTAEEKAHARQLARELSAKHTFRDGSGPASLSRKP